MSSATATQPFIFKLTADAELHLRSNKVYVSGPITGIVGLNVPAFAAASAQLKEKGLDPTNPHDLHGTRDAKEWDDFMRTDLKHMMDVGLVYLLPGWQKSDGAVWEFLNAKVLNIPVITHELLVENQTAVEYVELFTQLINKIILHDKRILETNLKTPINL